MAVIEIVHVFNEIDLIDVHLHELKDIVKKHIIVEHSFGHGMQPQKLYFSEAKNAGRFDEFKDKIIHLVDDNTYGGLQDMGLHFSRFDSPLIMNILRDNFDPTDYVISPAADAIIKKEIFDDNFDYTKITHLHMKWYQFWFDCVSPVGYSWTPATPLHYLLELGGISKIIFLSQQKGFEDYKHPSYWPAGWHFGKCGGAKMVQEQIIGYPHQLYNLPHLVDIDRIQERIDKALNWDDSPTWDWKYEKFDPAKWPQYIGEHPEIYADKYFKNKMQPGVGDIDAL